MNETWPEIKKRKLKERRGETFDWIQSLVVALFACVLIFTFLVRVIGVVGTSMLNTLHPGDRILVSNLFYTPKRGDVIVLRKESFNSEPIVMRVIATEGENVTIDFESGIVYVHGAALDEPYTLEPTYRRIDFGDDSPQFFPRFLQIVALADVKVPFFQSRLVFVFGSRVDGP